jgi:hypothetical protein
MSPENWLGPSASSRGHWFSYFRLRHIDPVYRQPVLSDKELRVPVLWAAPSFTGFWRRQTGPPGRHLSSLWELS